MSNYEPFDRLVGPLQVFIAPVSSGTAETKPDVDTTPAGNWVSLGPTDGEQSIEHSETAVSFRDNDHSGPVKVARQEEDVMVKFTVVGLTLENYAWALRGADDVSADAGPPAIKQVNLKRGFEINQVSLLLKGAAISPYGDYPGQYYIPKAFPTGSPTPTWGRGGSPGLEVEFIIVEDDDQAAGEEMGWLEAQTA